AAGADRDDVRDRLRARVPGRRVPGPGIERRGEPGLVEVLGGDRRLGVRAGPGLDRALGALALRAPLLIETVDVVLDPALQRGGPLGLLPEPLPTFLGLDAHATS